MHHVAYKTWVQGRLARQHSDIETNNTTARPQQGSLETGITSAPEKCTKNTHFTPAKATAVSDKARPARAKVMAVSVKARPTPAEATTVSDKRPCCPTGPGGGTHGWWRGPAGLRDDAPSNISTPGPTGVEGAGGTGGHGRASRRGAERSEAA